jgi:multicomponent Na+:H+ antiporter subunit B
MTSFLIIHFVLLALVGVTALAIVEVRNLLNAAALVAANSLLIALLWAHLDALEVALMQVAVGAGIVAMLIVGTLSLVGRDEKVRRLTNWPALLLVIAVGAVMVWGTLDMPAFGDSDAPVHTSPVAQAMTEQQVQKHAQGASAAADPALAQNVERPVQSVVANYRATDTLFRMATIFAAAMAMIMLLRGRRGHPLKGGLL